MPYLVEMVQAYYCEIVVTNVLDLVPKTIMLNMVYHTTGPKFQLLKQNTENESVKLKQFLTDKLQARAGELLVESEDITTRRQQADDAIEVKKNN